jgi:RNA polymerase sigma factor (sigma-70 family)
MFLQLKRKNLSEKQEELSDEQLVSGYLESGDKELIAELFERYIHLVYGICLNYLQDTDKCKDAVMEIFEGLFHTLTAHKVLNFRNWLYSVSRNHCLMIIRKSGTYNRVKNSMEQQDSELPRYNPEEEELRYSKNIILSAVDHLNDEQGTCIRLMYIDDKSYRDISSITGFTLNEVKSHIQNGKRNIKQYLLKQDGKQEI